MSKDGSLLHPQLNLPYHQYCIISEQEFAGAPWLDCFDFATMKLIEQMREHSLALVFVARSTRFDAMASPKSFVRVVWIKKPSQTVPRPALTRAQNTF